MTSTISAPFARKAGDEVSIDDAKYPGIWTIQSVGPKNCVVIPKAGGRGLRAPKWMIVDPNYDAAPPVPETEAYVSYYAGEVVRITGFGGKYDGLYVVLVDKGERVNVAKLGGDGNRYLRIPRRSLTKVDAADVLK